MRVTMPQISRGDQPRRNRAPTTDPAEVPMTSSADAGSTPPTSASAQITPAWDAMPTRPPAPSTRVNPGPGSACCRSGTQASFARSSAIAHPNAISESPRERSRGSKNSATPAGIASGLRLSWSMTQGWEPSPFATKVRSS